MSPRKSRKQAEALGMMKANRGSDGGTRLQQWQTPGDTHSKIGTCQASHADANWAEVGNAVPSKEVQSGESRVRVR